MQKGNENNLADVLSTACGVAGKEAGRSVGSYCSHLERRTMAHSGMVAVEVVINA